jgi:hypothetical protein
VTLTVTDDNGNGGTATYHYVVVYDPNRGFVSGGGWIDSPEGAYIPDPSLSGKGSFGFVSKYLKGAKVPSGNTEFQFQAGSFNFHSTSYEWLMVSKDKVTAQSKGFGTVNGAMDSTATPTSSCCGPGMARLTPSASASGGKAPMP